VVNLIYAIGDLHLGFSTNKSMDVFGKQWNKHYDKIKGNWLSTVKDCDLVLIAGDTSWAISLEEAEADLDYLNELPGTKVLVKGNHDYWWQSLAKMKEKYRGSSLNYLQNDVFIFEECCICGARGWLCPNESDYTQEDKKIYTREIRRLELSLERAKGHRNKIVVMHYPPMNEHLEPSEFTFLFHEYDVKQVLYGHVHGDERFKYAPLGVIDGIHYQLISSDYLNFKLHPVDLLII